MTNFIACGKIPAEKEKFSSLASSRAITSDDNLSSEAGRKLSSEDFGRSR